jgi:hypothetical protein
MFRRLLKQHPAFEQLWGARLEAEVPTCLITGALF